MDHQEAGRKAGSDLIQSGQRKAGGVHQKEGTQGNATASPKRAADQELSVIQKGVGSRGDLMKGCMVYGKGMQLQEPGSGPHSLIK